jgi:hypothetical protein
MNSERRKLIVEGAIWAVLFATPVISVAMLDGTYQAVFGKTVCWPVNGLCCDERARRAVAELTKLSGIEAVRPVIRAQSIHIRLAPKRPSDMKIVRALLAASVYPKQLQPNFQCACDSSLR